MDQAQWSLLFLCLLNKGEVLSKFLASFFQVSDKRGYIIGMNDDVIILFDTIVLLDRDIAAIVEINRNPHARSNFPFSHYPHPLISTFR